MATPRGPDPVPLANGCSRAPRAPHIGHRSRRHHQRHGPGCAAPAERHETPVPVRSNALEARVHSVARIRRVPALVTGAAGGTPELGQVSLTPASCLPRSPSPRQSAPRSGFHGAAHALAPHGYFHCALVTSRTSEAGGPGSPFMIAKTLESRETIFSS